MTRLVRAAAVALLAAAAVALPAPAAAAPAADTVLVPSSGEPVRTSFTSKTGSSYRFTVTGAYSYNGRQNLADCGWWNPETAGDAWYPGGFFHIDGVSARCASMAYTTTHTYTWEQPGTGGAFAFQVTDGLYYDNVGGLSVTVAEVATAPTVRGTCDVVSFDDTETGLTALDVVVRASASGGELPPMARATCYIVGPAGVAATVSTVGTGPEAVGADVVLLPRAPYDACVQAEADWIFPWETRYSTYTCRPV